MTRNVTMEVEMSKVYLTETEELKAKFAAWVYAQMKMRKITQRSLAKKRGISHQAFSVKLSTRSFSIDDYLFFVKEFQPSAKELMELNGL